MAEKSIIDDTTEAFDAPLEILYRDDRYIAIHKPAGLLVHRSPIDRRETRFAIQLLRDQIGQRVYPVHRLDKPTSGVLVFALDDQAHLALSLAFQERLVSKTYLAVTRGHAPEAGEIDHPLRKFLDKDGHIKGDDAQPSLTAFERVGSVELAYPTDRYDTTRLSLVRLSPRTGRRHQLRRHLAHLNHPIIGDTRYGDNKLNRSARDNFGIKRLMLAATSLQFEQPFTAELRRIDAPLQDDFRSALQTIGLKAAGSGHVS